MPTCRPAHPLTTPAPGATEGFVIDAALRATPWVVPGTLVLLAVASVAALVLAERWRTRRWVLAALVMAAGLPLLVTISPSATLEGAVATSSACALGWPQLPAPGQLTGLSATSLNLVLFAPLGLLLPLLGRASVRRATIGVALGLPFLVEAAQRLVPALGRSCQVDDVALNLTGLLVGLAIGTAVARVGRRRRPSDTDREPVGSSSGP
jgi:VanZ family protein